MLEKRWFTRFFRSGRRFISQDLQQKADAAGPEAQNNLGAFFSNSDQPEAAMASYLKAAEHGYAVAQSNLGLMFTTGQGAQRDDAQAQYWFGRAAAQGHGPAQFHLGRRWHRASLTLPDRDAREARIEAFKWLQLASAQGYPNAEASRERVNIAMNSEDVAEGNRRVRGFVSRPESGHDSNGAASDAVRKANPGI